MIRWFRRKRPTPTPPRLPVSEALIISAWRLTESKWQNMDPRTRAWHRENITKADAYAPTYSE